MLLLLLLLLFFNKIFDNDVGAISIDSRNGNGNDNGIYSSIHLVWFQSFDDNDNVSFDGDNDSDTSTDKTMIDNTIGLFYSMPMPMMVD